MLKSEFALDLHLRDADEAVLHSTLAPECLGCISTCETSSEKTAQCMRSNERRRGIVRSAEGTVFLCTNDPDYLSSSKTFKRLCDFYQRAVGQVAVIKSVLQKQQLEQTNRLLHNLTSLNAHLIQDLYALVSQESLSSTSKFKDQRKLVAEKIRLAPEEAADTFLRVRKNATSMKNEFSAYRKLNDRNPILNLSSHVLHKVLLNVTNLFFSDFADKNVRLVIDSCDVKVRIDYESIQVAFYHLLDNATKYVRPDTELRVSFETTPSGLEVHIRMVSVCIDGDEVDRIYDDTYSGKYAKQSGYAGKGLGMGIVRDLLRLNQASISVSAGPRLASSGATEDSTSTPYANNVFVIIFAIGTILSQGPQRARPPTVPRFRQAKK